MEVRVGMEFSGHEVLNLSRCGRIDICEPVDVGVHCWPVGFGAFDGCRRELLWPSYNKCEGKNKFVVIGQFEDECWTSGRAGYFRILDEFQGRVVSERSRCGYSSCRKCIWNDIDRGPFARTTDNYRGDGYCMSTIIV